jgi:hypothetical protein
MVTRSMPGPAKRSVSSEWLVGIRSLASSRRMIIRWSVTRIPRRTSRSRKFSSRRRRVFADILFGNLTRVWGNGKHPSPEAP